MTDEERRRADAERLREWRKRKRAEYLEAHKDEPPKKRGRPPVPADVQAARKREREKRYRESKQALKPLKPKPEPKPPKQRKSPEKPVKPVPLELYRSRPKYCCVISEHHSDTIHAIIETRPFEPDSARFLVKIKRNGNLIQAVFPTHTDAMKYLKQNGVHHAKAYKDISEHWLSEHALKLPTE